MKIITFFLSLMSTFVHATVCHESHPIYQKPIQFDKKRLALTRDYQKTHYGIDSINIEPKMIVLHWTSMADFNQTFRMFNQSILPAYRHDKLPGDLNVSSHFLVNRDGRIYQLMPETWMARHVIGLNHYAIGIENIGGVDGKDDLTEAQAKANAFLVRHLTHKYPGIRYVIGHNEYLKFKSSPLWLEKNPNYQTDKTDPGLKFVKKVKKLVRSCQ